MTLTRANKKVGELSSLLFDIGYRHSYDVVFNDFLTITICALGYGTNEERYFETIKRYNNAELQIFVKAFAKLNEVYMSIDKGQWIDPLGLIYEEITSKGKSSALGQFFTPVHICNLIAAINKPADWGAKINEPACGSGRMVLAMNAQAEGNEYICQDVDSICCKMTAINMSFHQMRGVVYHMDVLAQEAPRTTYVINHEIWKYKCISIRQF